MPFGSLPTSGGGLRCWHIYQGLKSRGIDVIASMPSFTFLTKKYFNEIPEDIRENLWEWHTQDEIYNRIKPDAVIYSSNWDHYNLSKKPNVPLIIDLHGSRLIETSLWGETPDINKKLDTFSKADCLLVAGQKQKMYFYGWLLQSGRIPEVNDFIKYIPISLSPEKFVRTETPNDEYPLFVSGGGWFPWQDQSNAIFEISNSIIRRNEGKFKIYGTPHENSTPSSDELKIREIYNNIKNLSDQNARIQVQGYVGREELLKQYSKSSIAVELMKYNLERELAFTTRTIEYLWCGLPVIYNNYSEISEHIKEYDAGWAVDPLSDIELSRVISEIFENREKVSEKSRNAQKLVQDRFSWDKTIEPLVDYLNKPLIMKVSKPVKGFSASTSPYLSPSGNEVYIELKGGEKIKQDFIFPAEGIWAIQIPVSSVNNPEDAILNCRLKNNLGLNISNLCISLKDVQERGVLFLNINRLLRPSGGSLARLTISIEGSSMNKVVFAGLSQAIYPLKSNDNIKYIAKDSLSRDTNAEALLVHFLPGAGRLFQLKMKIYKAIWLIRQGDSSRLLRAIMRRLPVLAPVLKHFV